MVGWVGWVFLCCWCVLMFGCFGFLVLFGFGVCLFVLWRCLVVVYVF